jgi:hypothetical protein
LAGARWVQTQLLAKLPSNQLRVYAVWLPMLGGDAREEWNGNTMPDPRVIHFWDGDTKVGQWFAEKVEGYRGVSWDAYYLYGPDAKWESVPSPLVEMGGTIYSERETLKMQLMRLLEN